MCLDLEVKIVTPPMNTDNEHVPSILILWVYPGSNLDLYIYIYTDIVSSITLESCDLVETQLVFDASHAYRSMYIIVKDLPLSRHLCQ